MTKRNAVFVSFALLISLLSISGLRFHSTAGFILFMVGFPGDVVMILMTGVHGGGTWGENLVGGIVAVVIDTVFFYWVFRLALWAKRKVM